MPLSRILPTHDLKQFAENYKRIFGDKTKEEKNEDKPICQKEQEDQHS